MKDFAIKFNMIDELLNNSDDKAIIQKCKAFKKYIDKSNQMFNYKFDYSKFEYVKAKHKSIITCPIHGEFIQSMDKHTSKDAHGCYKCFNENRPYPTWLIREKGTMIIPYKEFLKRAKKRYGNKFSYVEESYKGMKNKMIINCKIHGEFETTPHSFLICKYGCPKCSKKYSAQTKTHSYEEFLTQAKKIHGNKYEYLEENKKTYKNKESIVKIKCKIHGVFKKRAQKHLSGQACFKCRINELVKNDILIGNYSEYLFIKKPELKNKKCILYLLQINNSFYKVGITTTKLKNRINNLISKAKQSNEILDIKIIHTKHDTLYNCFKLEQKILSENASERIFKKWSTELLNNIIIEKYFN